MAIEILSSDDSSSSPMLLSPRISFSHDLSPSDRHLLLPPSIPSSSHHHHDFDFFSSDRLPPSDHDSSPADRLFSHGKLLPLPINNPPPPPPPPPRNHSLPRSPSVKKQRITRSASLNSGGGGGLFRLLPLLSRSSSTGSRGTNNAKHHHRPSTSTSSPLHHQKPPPPCDSYRFGNGGRIKPVLNVANSGTSGGLFGFGYIFGGGNNKNKKK
ncbi:hypothetical protein QJS10_CPB12g00391 [Acorus calamus]|uniref:Uncharacterized protein n=1 Tax=Acorus calamus TaxID=4465 RepID=A0AAV9DP02_ACOCL|nr:hypothetical protein QJS10_CPB12g00391 [Acorus calamus]